MKRIGLYTIILLVMQAHAQHFQFSQFYASPTYLNPAFTGANVCGRLSLNYRQQWSGIPGTFTSYQASFDHTLLKYKSGIGIQFFSDEAGLGSLQTTQVNFLYAYETRVSKKLMGRAGVSFGNVQRRVNYDQFTFGDQLARRGAPATVENLAYDNTNYLDAGAGFILFTKSSWFGMACAHLNKPNQSLMNGNAPLPRELKFHGGYRFVIDEHESSNKKIPLTESVTFAANYKKQQKFNQIDLGVYYAKNLFVMGCWYRGIPLFRPVNIYQNNDAVIFLFGLNIEKYKFGYSYDMTLSRLGNLSTRGTHEVTMSYQFCKVKKIGRRKKLGVIHCPKF